MRLIISPLYLQTLLICLFCWACGAGENDHTRTSREQADLVRRVDSVGRHFIEQNGTRGISIAIRQDGELLYNRGFGFVDSAQTQPVTNAHRFKLASVSKLVGATMVMKLVEEGQLSLENSLAELLPDYPNPTQGQTIRLWHLLSHTSGLADYAMELDSAFEATGVAPSRQDYLDFFDRHELFFEPGTQYAYSNSGFKLMEFIIERATGRSFRDEIERIINTPARLHFDLVAQSVSDPMMSGYFDFRDSVMARRPLWTWISGDGGMTATAAELSLFPFLWSDGTLITQASYHRMSSPIRLENGLHTGYGLGVRTGTLEGEPVVGHSGGNRTAYAMMQFFPEKNMSVVVFDNTDGSPTSALDIIGPVALEALGKPRPDLAALDRTDEDLSAYTGTYAQFGYRDAEPTPYSLYISDKDKHLYRKDARNDSPGQKLYYIGDQSFAYEAFPMDRIVFERDAEGNLAAYRVYWYGLFQRMAFRQGEKK